MISLSATNRGDIQIHLTSPAGTRSTLLARRPLDNSHNGFHSWPFMSVHFWGESPFGIWSIEVENEGRASGNYFGSLKNKTRFWYAYAYVRNQLKIRVKQA